MTEQVQTEQFLSGIHAYYEPEELVGKTLNCYYKPSTKKDDGN